MKKSITVQLAQVNYRYGNNAYLPYSVGLLQAKALADPILKKNVRFLPIIFLRSKIDDVVAGLEDVDVLALSCYIWNWNWNIELARKAKGKYPNLIVVVGGPQVPNDHKSFFAECPFVDFVIPNEGEIAFSLLLNYLVENLEPANLDIDGIISRYSTFIAVVEKKKNRIEDLNELPSPYTSGLFNSLIETFPNLQFQATQETHRGCPYSCTFCDWGSATMTKVRRFSIERLKNEFDWFGHNRIELLYNADANYGLFPEDIAITEAMIEAKRRLGFPKKFRAAYAKNSNDRVFEISQKLESEGMCKGVTLSFQSMDSRTLDLIKRRNMKINDFRSLITNYRRHNIPTYTELILGLPGETLNTFIEGIDLLLNAGQHDSLSIYHAMLLTNAEMNSKEYRELHGIKSQKIPLLLLHGTLENDDITEYYDVVTETHSMPKEDWIQASIYAWGIQAFHCLNLTQSIAVCLKELHNVDYSRFYKALFSFLEGSDSYLGQVFRNLRVMAINVNEGKGSFDFEDRSYGDIMWPVEEILFLKANEKGFWTILLKFLQAEFPEVDERDRVDLVNYQRISLKTCNEFDFPSSSFVADWHSFTNLLLENRPAKLNRQPCTIQIMNPCVYLSQTEYAREVVWYGRKGSSLRNSNLRVLEYPLENGIRQHFDF